MSDRKSDSPGQKIESPKGKTVGANYKKGKEFEKTIADKVRANPKMDASSVKREVPTKSGGRADIVAKDKSGQKFVYEAKKYDGTPIGIRHVEQVKNYAKDLDAKARLVVGDDTIVPDKVAKHAESNDVEILKGGMCQKQVLTSRPNHGRADIVAPLVAGEKSGQKNVVPDLVDTHAIEMGVATLALDDQL